MSIEVIAVLALLIFFQLIQYLVFFDVVSSWLQLAGVRFRPRFVSAILDPLYRNIQKYVPTKIGMFDLTPIIILFATMFIMGMIYKVFPGATAQIQSLTR